MGKTIAAIAVVAAGVLVADAVRLGVGAITAKVMRNKLKKETGLF